MSYVSSTRWGGALHAAPAHASALIASQDQLLINAFNAHHPRLDDQPAFDEPAYRARVEHMLQAQHARGEARRGVVGTHPHGRLGDDRPVIEVRGHEVHGAAVNLDARGKRARMRVETGKGRKKRRMNVEDSVRVAL